MRAADWILFALPVAFVVFTALRAQRHVRGVADFLSAGRIARRYFFWTNLVVPCLVGAVSTVWFGVFSSRDLLRLFRDLEARDRSGAGPDVADDGRVETS